uniref:Uncharacterized protein n=1 Tax=Candidatus Kentrum sp. TC TaxID=2126339 RepID=A0A450YSK0_9GAMM|nr:MAG: hypothetical protein BECKTC1821E_GA0114239_103633 [Candidatus Kentron sp. TC]
MISRKTINQIQNAPIPDRIQVIKILLESLQHDMNHSTSRERYPKPFRVRTFNLGADVSLDRDDMYAQRGI